jgi:putative ABC transport system substrate-binding protein
MLRWALIIGSIVAATLCPFVSYGQQPKAAPPKRVGILTQLVGCPIKPDNSIHRGLTELGWVEGQTFVFECVSTVGRLDQLPALAHELVSRQPDVLATSSIPLTKALKQETTTIPIVMLTAPDPVRAGLITNLARPEGNITGVAFFGMDILPKRIELLKELLPNLRRLATIEYAYPDLQAAAIFKENLALAAQTLGFTWQRFPVATANDYTEVFARLEKENFDAAYIDQHPFTAQNVKRIIELALHHHVPTVGERTDLVRDGLLLSYAQDLPQSVRRGTQYIDKILRGAKPSDLPVEQPTKFDLAINLKTAKTLGLTIPPKLLARADEVIE